MRSRLRFAYIVFGPLLVLPASVLACVPEQALLFACDTRNGKAVQVCDGGSQLHYTFGRPGQTPELTLRVPREKASTWQWAGIGRYITYSVSLPSGDTVYTVYTSVDKNTGSEEAGIDVSIREKQVANLLCRPGSVQARLEGVDLPLQP